MELKRVLTYTAQWKWEGEQKIALDIIDYVGEINVSASDMVFEWVVIKQIGDTDEASIAEGTVYAPLQLDHVKLMIESIIRSYHDLAESS